MNDNNISMLVMAFTILVTAVVMAVLSEDNKNQHRDFEMRIEQLEKSK